MKSHPFSLCIYEKSNTLPVKISEIKNKIDALKTDSIPLLTLKDNFFKTFNFIDNAIGNHYLKHGDMIYIEELNRYYIFGFDKNSENEIKAFGFHSTVYLEKDDKHSFRFISYKIFESLFSHGYTFKYICNIFIQKKAIIENFFNKMERTTEHKLTFNASNVQSRISFKDSQFSYYGENEHLQFLLDGRLFNLNLHYKNKDITNTLDILKYLNKDDSNFQLKINPRIHSTVKGDFKDGFNLRLYAGSIVSLKKESLIRYIKENNENKNKENEVILEKTKTIMFFLENTGYCHANYLDGKEHTSHMLYDNLDNYLIINKLENEKLYNEILLERL